MSNFIKEASDELEHVVWPTPVENKKYMMYTIGVIVVLGIFLAILGYSITNGLIFARCQITDCNAPISEIDKNIVSSEAVEIEDENVNNIINKVPKTTPSTASGSNTISGTTTGTGSK